MELHKKLKQIHHSVFDRFRYRSDDELWGQRDHWERYDEIPDKGYIYGDCDCFALACRKECRKLGIQSRLVFCKTKYGYHLVLECDGWILDNTQLAVVAHQTLDYEWISISGYERGEPWHRIV